MTLNLLFFVITIKKVPITLESAIHEEKQRQMLEADKIRMLEYRNRHIL